jgi:hypothetical protein
LESFNGNIEPNLSIINEIDQYDLEPIDNENNNDHFNLSE